MSPIIRFERSAVGAVLDVDNRGDGEAAIGRVHRRRQSDRMEGEMREYPWQAQYDAAIQAPDFLERVAVAKQKIYDRLEEYLQQRQQIDASEMKAIKKALCFLGNAEHDAAASSCSFAIGWW
jgi:hypothetical protein